MTAGSYSIIGSAFRPEGLDPLDGRLMVHRVNLTDAAAARVDEGLAARVGSKSGIAILDSAKRRVQLPPSASVEVDFWIFGEDRGVVTHHNPVLREIAKYPSLDEYLDGWREKRAAETALGAPHGLILANLKTHGSEERFFEICEKHGVPISEVVLLDQEPPASDRLMRQTATSQSAPLALRVSRIESLESVLMALRQDRTLAHPRAIFFDPVGSELPETLWPFDAERVSEMYRRAPRLEFILCCPSRWGRDDQIEPLARRCRESGLRAPMVMTDLDKAGRWEPILRAWEKAA